MSVIRPASYKIEEETADRLVLRAKRTFFILAGGFVAAVGGIFIYASTAVKAPFGAAALAIIGMLSLVGGIALIRVAIVKKNMIIFDQNLQVVNFSVWPRSLQAIIPYGSIASVDIDIVEETISTGGRAREEKYVVYKVNLVEKTGNKRQIDSSTKVDEMLGLAIKVAQRCGVPFKGAAPLKT